MHTGNVVAIRRTAAASTDEELVAACARGETAALGTLFERYHLDVYRFLSRLVGPGQADLDDLVQASFLEVFRGARGFRAQASVKTWMFAVAANVARHHARSEGRRKRVFAMPQDPPESPAPDMTRPDQQAEDRQMVGLVAEGLEHLPHDLRVAFIACEVEGLSGSEVATSLGIPKGTLWRRLHDARKALLSFIEGRHHESKK